MPFKFLFYVFREEMPPYLNIFKRAILLYNKHHEYQFGGREKIN